MKEELKLLIKNKLNLRETQDLFSQELERNYPNLIKEDTKDWTSHVNTELEYLLSSCLRYKSGRILIPTITRLASNEIQEKKVVLTRNPGLKNPNYQYSVVRLVEIEKIDSNGDFLQVGDKYLKFERVKMSILKSLDKIDQEKLEKFYEFIEKSIGWTLGIRRLITGRGYGGSSYDENEIRLKNGDVVKIFSKHFEICFKDVKELKEKSGFQWNSIFSDALEDYSWREKDKHDPDGIDNLSLLKEILSSFEDFDRVLKNAEERKRILINQAKDLLERLKKYNKPFRVLLDLVNS